MPPQTTPATGHERPVPWREVRDGRIERRGTGFATQSEADEFMHRLAASRGPVDIVPPNIRHTLRSLWTDDGERWLHRPHRDFGGDKPIYLITTGRAAEVARKLAEIA